MDTFAIVLRASPARELQRSHQAPRSVAHFDFISISFLSRPRPPPPHAHESVGLGFRPAESRLFGAVHPERLHRQQTPSVCDAKKQPSGATGTIGTRGWAGDSEAARRPRATFRGCHGLDPIGSGQGAVGNIIGRDFVQLPGGWRGIGIGGSSGFSGGPRQQSSSAHYEKKRPFHGNSHRVLPPFAI